MRMIIPIIISLSLTGCSIFTRGAGVDDVSAKLRERFSNATISATGSLKTEAVKKLLEDGLHERDVERLVLEHSPRVTSLLATLGISQAEFLSGLIPENPTISSERRWEGKATEFDVTQGVLSLVLLPLRRAAAKRNFEGDKLELVERLMHEFVEAKRLFWRYRSLEEQLQVYQEGLRAAKASELLLRELHRVGNVPLLELRREESLRARTQLETANFELQLIKAREELNKHLGLWGTLGNWKAEGALDQPPAIGFTGESVERIALESRPDLLALRERLDGEVRALQITDIESIIPELTLTSHYEREPDGSETIGPSLEFGVPIFDFGQIARGRARARLERMVAEYLALATEIRAESRQAYAAYNLAISRVHFFQSELLGIQESLLKESVLQYNAMTIDAAELIQAKVSQLQAKRDYWDALYEAKSTELELYLALGTGPLDTLKQAPAHHH